LAIWFDAADLSTITYGTGVSQWRDKSGFGRNAAQATGTNQPTWNASLQRGYPSIFFAGASAPDKYMTLSTLSGNGWTSAEMFYVWRSTNDPTVGSNGGSPVGQWGSSGTVDAEPWTDGIVYQGNLSTTRKTTVNPVTPLTQPNISNVRSAANDWSYWLNGVSLYSTATNTVGFGSTPLIGFSTTAAFQGYLSEIILINNVVSAYLRQKTEGYLAWKWGIAKNLSGSHPFVNRPPNIGD
jgi:hypothetical protein